MSLVLKGFELYYSDTFDHFHILVIFPLSWIFNILGIDMFGINSDRRVGISTLLGVAGDGTMIIIYIFSLYF